MSVDATRWAWMQAVTPTQKLLLLSLADMTDENNECYPPIKRLATDTGLSYDDVYTAIQALEWLGLIEARRTLAFGDQYRLIGVQELKE